MFIFANTDSWDAGEVGIITADGVEIWRQAPPTTGFNQAVCGGR